MVRGEPQDGLGAFLFGQEGGVRGVVGEVEPDCDAVEDGDAAGDDCETYRSVSFESLLFQVSWRDLYEPMNHFQGAKLSVLMKRTP